jgi:hypothetical protein
MEIFTLKEGIDMLKSIKTSFVFSCPEGIVKLRNFIEMLEGQVNYDEIRFDEGHTSIYYWTKFKDVMTILEVDEARGVLYFEEVYDELMQWASPPDSQNDSQNILVNCVNCGKN